MTRKSTEVRMGNCYGEFMLGQLNSLHIEMTGLTDNGKAVDIVYLDFSKDQNPPQGTHSQAVDVLAR